MKRLHAIIEGRVQGVSYRMYTQKQAQSLGIVGWVQNLPDSTVEVIAEGEQDKLEDLLAWLHKGSPMASVRRVHAEWQEANGKFKSFEIAYYSRKGGLYT